MRGLTIILFILYNSLAVAQTGPGGVGNSSSLPLWLKADIGSSSLANGASVSLWADQSGNSNNATQGFGARQPVYSTGVMNGMPAMFFDNSNSPNNDEFVVADNVNLDNTAGLTILTVARPTSINGDARAVVSKRIGAGDQQAYTMFFYTGNKLFIDVDGNGNRFSTNTTFAGNRDYVITTVFDGTLATANRSRVYVNENVDITQTEASATIPDYASPVTIGSMNVGDGRPFGGYIAEVIIFRKALNTPERIIAHNYLFAKYGLAGPSVPATTNDIYVGDDPGNGDYDFEVGGVGIDATGSNNSASSSVTGGMTVTQVSGFENGDYLLYGHQAGSTVTQLTDIGGMTGSNNARWSRIWYVDITNASTTETVNIAFDLSDAGTTVTPVNASNYVLLYRAGQVGNWTEVTTATSIAGDNINFPNISVPADGYYTLGSRNYIASPLPVGLLDFTGDFTEKGVELRWSTATEWNNDYFTIERSPDGDNFRPIAIVNGSGNSFREISYEAVDHEPFNGKTYYRLMQTDFDGTITNLKTIVVNTTGSSFEISLFPNPSNGTFFFDLPFNTTDSQVTVFNSAGQKVSVSYYLLGSRVSVDAQQLPKGLYILKLVTTRGIHVAKFVIE